MEFKGFELSNFKKRFIVCHIKFVLLYWNTIILVYKFGEF